MDRDFVAKDALQPVLKLVLGPNGEELRSLVIREDTEWILIKNNTKSIYNGFKIDKTYTLQFIMSYTSKIDNTIALISHFFFYQLNAYTINII